MNQTQLEEEVWIFFGLHDAGQREDWMRQKIRNALNIAQRRVANAAPYLFSMVYESTISIVSGTSTYGGSDWVKRFLSFWTIGDGAHKVHYKMPRNVDRDGSRNTNLVFGSQGPYILTHAPRTKTATVSGTAASATEGATSITGVSGLGSASAYVGRMVQLNNDGNDYKISAHTATTITTDKAIRSPMTGLGVTGLGSGYSSVPWAVGPVGRQQVQILPAPTSSVTLYYRAQHLPRSLIGNTDVPEIDEDYHHLIWKAALKELSALVEDQKMYGIYQAEVGESLAELMRTDNDTEDSEDGIGFVSEMSEEPDQDNSTPGTYNR